MPEWNEQLVQQERLRRWRLIIGTIPESADQGDGNTAGDGTGSQPMLSEQDAAMDAALEALYGDEGGLGDSAPEIVRWLDDIRRYFPESVADMLRQEAQKHIKPEILLSEPELLAQIEPDIELVARLLALSRVMPSKVRETARAVVRQVVEELVRKLTIPLQRAVHGSLSRSQRTRHPRHQAEINWLQTIRANLKHYQIEQQTIIPEQLIGYGKRKSTLRDVILCIDQSGSMAQSVVYASVFGSVLASLPALTTHLVAFSTNVVDLTSNLHDPVDLLFGIQLRGGTNIDRAIGYCQQLITRPRHTTLILISDLFEGGNREHLVKRMQSLVADGVQVVVLLALSDQGIPRHNKTLAQELSSCGIVSFACTPDMFPDLMAAVLNQRSIATWLSAQQW